MLKKITGILLALSLLLGVALPVSAFECATSAKASILIDADSGRVLSAQNEKAKLPMASTTKIMTTLIALEQPDLTSYFTVDPEAIKVEGSSMGLTEGDRVNLLTLCYGMILPSGNDAANVVAMRIGGSAEKFADMMNAKAAELGLKDTHFVTPSGLDADGHYTTAYDLAQLARIAMQNPLFKSICKESAAQVEFGNPPFKRWLKNHNKLIEMYDGCIGVKTGFTDAAKRCLVSAAERDGVTLICVTLNDPNDWADHAKYYDAGFATLKMRTMEAAESYPVKVTGGTAPTVQAKVSGPVQILLTDEEAQKVQPVVTTEPFLYAPVKAGDVIGQLQYRVDGELMASVPLIAASDVGAAFTYKKEESLSDKAGGFFSGIIDWFKGLFG
ncbi:D-alanyl-D-alanine carboxypeptidase family protein [Candidatus Soleaferrea massiliensis]|uniref:D-alanyl-D-alanine carboxypeptidase family protein n=1 Tax=Candidatus Soleaferrea massiliensis TaxID=1470354 RepID=UPI00058B9B7D|nr:D-alanyl-D-alanine carboxypeptidase family protein [Candidatus Soleaferrea massiliensis]